MRDRQKDIHTNRRGGACKLITELVNKVKLGRLEVQREGWRRASIYGPWRSTVSILYFDLIFIKTVIRRNSYFLWKWEGFREWAPLLGVWMWRAIRGKLFLPLWRRVVIFRKHGGEWHREFQKNGKRSEDSEPSPDVVFTPGAAACSFS